MDGRNNTEPAGAPGSLHLHGGAPGASTSSVATTASIQSAAPPARAPAATSQSILVQEGERKENKGHAHFADVQRHPHGVHGPVLSPSPRVQSPLEEEHRAQTPSSTSGRATIKQASHPRIIHDDGKIHILIGSTGSLHISALKQIITKLRNVYEERAAIHLILTKAAAKITRTHEIPSYITVWHDEDEWNWHARTDPVIHIELRRWADILIVAPCSANTMGKIAMGLCDNLLTNVVRAWNPQNPIFIAPAMVSYAYANPATKFHLSIIKQEMKWIEVLKPTEKVAGSYGGIGLGGMMAWTEIADKVITKLGGYLEDDEDEDNEDEAAIDKNKAALRKQQSLDESAVDDEEEEEEDDESVEFHDAEGGER